MPQITSVIKYEGDNTTFVWKHPCEDFNTQTQLIVHESQEAVFYMNGQILDVFQAGRHTLETQNIPLISKFYNKVFGGDTPFHCEVYFINKTEQMAIKWGTDSKIEYMEPTYNFPLQIGASGEMSLRVADAKRLLIKIVGTEKEITQESIVQRFRAFLMLKFKTYMSTYIRENSINIFQIDEKLTEISDCLHKLLKDDFLEYGVSLIHFFVTTIVKPEDDITYKRFKYLHFRQYADIVEARLQQNIDLIEQETEKKRTILEAEGIAAKRQIEGYTYHQERGYDVAEAAAGNEGSGEMTNLGIGLGMMSSVGGVVGGMVSESIDRIVPTGNKEGIICHKCGGHSPANARFCIECGSKLQIVCPNCQKEVPTGAKFCLECGQKLEE